MCARFHGHSTYITEDIKERGQNPPPQPVQPIKSPANIGLKLSDFYKLITKLFVKFGVNILIPLIEKRYIVKPGIKKY